MLTIVRRTSLGGQLLRRKRAERPFGIVPLKVQVIYRANRRNSKHATTCGCQEYFPRRVVSPGNSSKEEKCPRKSCQGSLWILGGFGEEVEPLRVIKHPERPEHLEHIVHMSTTMAAGARLDSRVQ